MVKSLLRRPFDLVCFIYFASHIPITLIVDSQAGTSALPQPSLILISNAH
jgi:hypothetical protein